MTRADDALRAQALQALAETLDVEATLARVPGLSREVLRAFLIDAAAHGEEPFDRAPRSRTVILHTDGACRGNPGRSGAGALIRAEDGREIARVSRYLGQMTNNMAEYTALLLGLKEARAAGAENITVKSDSELLVRQINGQYRVKNDALQIMHQSALDLLGAFKRWKVVHVPREENSEADKLANQAIDREA
jgi:ribonuclease HI